MPGFHLSCLGGLSPPPDLFIPSLPSSVCFSVLGCFPLLSSLPLMSASKNHNSQLPPPNMTCSVNNQYLYCTFVLTGTHLSELRTFTCFILPFHRRGNKGTRRLRNLLKVTPLTNRPAWIEPKPSVCRVQPLSGHAILSLQANSSLIWWYHSYPCLALPTPSPLGWEL